MHLRSGETLLLSMLAAVVLLAGLSGCQSTQEQLVGKGYPPAFADGYQDGCNSGRQAAGSLGTFSKNVPRYLNEKLYTSGWDDGFRQCQANLLNDDQKQFDEHFWNDRDRDWEQQKTQGEGRAYRSR